MLVSKEEYLSWIGNKKIHKVKRIESLEYPYLYEFGIPEMLLDCIFFVRKCMQEIFLQIVIKKKIMELFFLIDINLKLKII